MALVPQAEHAASGRTPPPSSAAIRHPARQSGDRGEQGRARRASVRLDNTSTHRVERVVRRRPERVEDVHEQPVVSSLLDRSSLDVVEPRADVRSTHRSGNPAGKTASPTMIATTVPASQSRRRGQRVRRPVRPRSARAPRLAPGPRGDGLSRADVDRHQTRSSISADMTAVRSTTPTIVPSVVDHARAAGRCSRRVGSSSLDDRARRRRRRRTVAPVAGRRRGHDRLDGQARATGARRGRSPRT